MHPHPTIPIPTSNLWSGGEDDVNRGGGMTGEYDCFIDVCEVISENKLRVSKRSCNHDGPFAKPTDSLHITTQLPKNPRIS